MDRKAGNMAGDFDGAQTQEEPQAPEDEREHTPEEQPQVGGAPDYERAIAERDERIAALEAQVADAAKSAEAAEELRAQIAELKAQGESDRVDFRLRLAGARNLKAARAVLADHDGDVEALVAAEPWLFSQAGALLNKLLRIFPARRAWSPLGPPAARASAT